MSQCLFSTQNLLFPGSSLLFDFPSLSREYRNLSCASHSKWLPRPRVLRLSFARADCASRSASYGGWDDPCDSDHSGEEFRKFVASLGIDDRKQIFVFLLGLLCAFAISRVRVSSIVVFPASVLVFAVGFSFGLVRGGGKGELNNGGKKDEILRVYIDRIRRLGKIVDDFDIHASNLKYKVKKAIDSREVHVSDLEDYMRLLESIGSSASDARDVISNAVSVENQKPNKRKKELGEIGFEFLQSVGGLFRENISSQKPAKVKNTVKNDDQTRAGNLVSSVEEETVQAPVNGNELNINHPRSQNLLNELSFDENRDDKVRNGSINWKDISGYSKGFSDSKEFSFQKNRMRSQNNHSISLKTGHDQTETWESQDNLLESVNFSVRTEHTETEASFVRKQKLERSEDVYRSSSRSRDNRENITNESRIREEINISGDDISDDAVFDGYLGEASYLLSQAKEFMRDEDEKERAEIVLKRCAQLLSKGIALKPESLLAVGQLGNTYLLHGELKLRISRELRTLLHTSNRTSARTWGTIQSQINRKDDIASTLINVCEECEELLMEAGRKYRVALSIDGNDPRALYNWGLALTFRAQLISDIGPEAAFEADKVFLAAIDKFDAMMSKGSVYAPDALYRWGVILQQRSHLRPIHSREKAKLLNQAKRLYEDALDINSNNVQVREALSTCISELSDRQF